MHGLSPERGRRRRVGANWLRPDGSAHAVDSLGVRLPRRRLVVLLLAGGGTVAMAPAARQQAERLVAAYARAIGAPGRKLGRDGSVAFGESGFDYDDRSGELIGRVYVQKAMLEGASPTGLLNLRRMVDALNDPKVGGMYDRADGYFVLDEGRDAYFLVRRFPVSRTSSSDLIAAMERMKTVAATWVVRWFYEVAMVMHGHRAAPTARVDLPK